MRTVSERFWSKVDKESGYFPMHVLNVGHCWLWTGCATSDGYGSMRVKSSTQLAHRVAWALVKGEIRGGLEVLHRCDVPACQNPDHLFLGTQEENNHDRQAKGRTAFGEASGLAKLTEMQVLGIRANYATGSYSHRELAKMYGVGKSIIGEIIRRRIWTHI